MHVGSYNIFQWINAVSSTRKKFLRNFFASSVIDKHVPKTLDQDMVWIAVHDNLCYMA